MDMLLMPTNKQKKQAENIQIVNLQGMYISNIVKKVKMLPHFPESLYQILVVQTYPSLQMLPV